MALLVSLLPRVVRACCRITSYGQVFVHHIGREFADVATCDNPARLEDRELLSDRPNKI
jgi:hypothetical protein